VSNEYSTQPYNFNIINILSFSPRCFGSNNNGRILEKKLNFGKNMDFFRRSSRMNYLLMLIRTG